MTTKGRPNLRRLADELGLSMTTVSRALRDRSDVHPDTIRRVKAAADAAGYVPNLHGRALRTGLTRNLTAILPMETRDYLSDIIKLPLIEGMTLAARELGYSLTIFSTTPEESPQENLDTVLHSGAADGVVITRMLAEDPRIPFLLKRRVPFIAFGRSNIDRDFAYIDIDNERIACEATSLLIERGRHRIALQLLTREDQHSAMRLAGYRAAIEDHGLTLDPDLIGHEDFTMGASEMWIERLLDSADPPTGLVCANELGLLGTLSALRKRGIAPGRDFSIATRDNTRIARYLSTPLVTHSVDMVSVGRALVEGLVRQIEHPHDPLTQEVFTGEMSVIGDE
ncbi:LacI family DNA-binding transcriptional regulator [Rhizobium lusitanum]|uniref:LacI family DNA-binding transcriptional regulator n=1 Tax=Rhizobium lusitanum TaxID=293958 RepID=UPI00195C11B4|nr:LacI family DNA-binding transcriptional regulator [Rhizobium lusitanum]MBM7048384.1 LacI family DNA-binding transcriptional regulator [Rhizobium lusitanum]